MSSENLCAVRGLFYTYNTAPNIKQNLYTGTTITDVMFHYQTVSERNNECPLYYYRTISPDEAKNSNPRLLTYSELNSTNSLINRMYPKPDKDFVLTERKMLKDTISSQGGLQYYSDFMYSEDGKTSPSKEEAAVMYGEMELNLMNMDGFLRSNSKLDKEEISNSYNNIQKYCATKGIITEKVDQNLAQKSINYFDIDGDHKLDKYEIAATILLADKDKDGIVQQHEARKFSEHIDNAVKNNTINNFKAELFEEYIKAKNPNPFKK